MNSHEQEKIVICLDGTFHPVDEMFAQGTFPLGEFKGKVFEFFGKRIQVNTDLRVDNYRYLGCVYEEPQKGNVI